MKKIGTVTHYYGNIGVAIIELSAKLSVGDMIKFESGGNEFEQKVESMQVEHKDIEAAKAVCNEDDVVDALYDHAYGELVHIMIGNPKTIQGATYLILAAHNLERIADRVTNIAESIVFMVTGKMEEMNVSKY